MKVKPGPHAVRGAMAAALTLLLAACVDYGGCANEQASATPSAGADSGSAPDTETGSISTTPATPTSSMPAAGGAPQASPAVPPPVYPAPNDNWSPGAGADTAAAPATSTAPDVVVPDTQLAARIRSALAAHSPTRGLHIQIAAHDGVVRLTGSVPTSVQIDQVNSVVSDVEGVKEVNNLLHVGK